MLYRIINKLQAMLMAMFVTVAPGVTANPEGGVVVRGHATIHDAGPGRLDVSQTSDKAIIDWREFSIQSNEHTHFQQPDNNAIALNRVTGEDRSDILGQLTANGKLFLVNPNGILFGQTANVDVAGLLATTSDISNDDFMAGRYDFNTPGNTTATVINEGIINVAENGLVALVAPGVSNTGIIRARLGKVALASGNRFTLDMYGDQLIEFALDDELFDEVMDADGKVLEARVSNSGSIYADGGAVLLAANTAKGILNQAINMDGLIQARAAEVKGGEIVLLGGDGGEVRVAGTLDASGDGAGQSGGTIEVLGEKTIITNIAQIDVSGANGGGFAELSGKELDLDVSVDLSGGTGPGGILTLDPITFTVDTGAAAGIVGSLATGGTVNVAAEQTINVNAEIDSSGQAGTATLNFQDENTDNNLVVNLNAKITLGTNQNLTGDATTVNVANTADIQDGIDVSSAGATVNVAAGTYDENVTLNKQGLTVSGTPGAILSIDRGETGFNITTNNVTLSGMEIVGPFDTSFTQVDWANEGNVFGVSVGANVTGITISNNTIRNTRTGVSFLSGSQATATGNLIDNTKGSFLIRTDNITMSGNAIGTNGSEWDIVFLNGVTDGAYATSPNVNEQQYGADILTLSSANGGMRVLDRRYGSNGLLGNTPQFGNRSHVDVSAGSSFTAADDFNLGNGLGNLRQPLGDISTAVDAVVHGGFVNVQAGNYAENVVIDKSLSLLLATGGVNLTSLQSTAGITTGLAGVLTVSNTLNMAGTVALSGDLTITAGAGDVTLNSVNGGFALNVNAGTINLGAAGINNALASLNLSATDMTLAGVSTSGAQTYNGNANLSGNYAGSAFSFNGNTLLQGDVTLNAGTGAVISNAVDGGFTLNVNAGTINLGAAGTNNTLAGLALSATDMTLAGVSTSGAQTYNGNANLSGNYIGSAFSFNGDAILQSDVTVNTSQGNGAIQFAGSIDGVTATSQDLILNAGTGAVTTVDIGQNVTLGDLVITSGNYDASSGTTNVSTLTVNGDEVRLGENTLNALNGVNIIAALISGTINANDVVLAATGVVDTIVNAFNEVAVNAGQILGVINATNVTLDATETVNTTITAANTVSVDAGQIIGAINAANVTLDATETVNTTITATSTVTVDAAEISGTINASNVTLEATGTVDTTINASETISVEAGDISGDFKAPTATFVADNNITVTADIDDLNVSAATATISGDLENVNILPGSGNLLVLDDSSLLQSTDTLGNERSILEPESVSNEAGGLLISQTSSLEDAGSFDITFNIVGVPPSSSEATAALGNQFLNNVSLYHGSSEPEEEAEDN